jgi:transcription antitermination factor NusB
MRKRTQARELALQLLYQVDLLRDKLARAEEDRFLTEYAEGAEVREYARVLVDGVRAHAEEIDRAIDEVAKNWEIGRMAVIDRNVLRMGCYEILFREDIPAKVAINEAVDLAKKYSTKNSSGFVNGILDKLRERRPGETPRSSADASEKKNSKTPAPAPLAAASMDDHAGAEPVDDADEPPPAEENGEDD